MKTSQGGLTPSERRRTALLSCDMSGNNQVTFAGVNLKVAANKLREEFPVFSFIKINVQMKPEGPPHRDRSSCFHEQNQNKS